MPKDPPKPLDYAPTPKRTKRVVNDKVLNVIAVTLTVLGLLILAVMVVSHSCINLGRGFGPNR